MRYADQLTPVCLVNTIEGVWKLKDEEQALRISAEKETGKKTVEKRKAEAKARTAEQEKWMAETREKKAEELKEQAERDREKMADEVDRIREQHGEARGRMEKRTTFVKAGSTRVTVPTTWVGTESLQTLDGTAYSLAPNTLTQSIKLDPGCWRTAFTRPIYDGEWELKIRASDNIFVNVSLGFLQHPLPENATQLPCENWVNGIGGHFNLGKGSLRKSNTELMTAGTNKTCDRIGQTAAIRVNMRTREARLFLDDEEQPGIFTDIPSPLCLGISTHNQNHQIEVLWLNRLRGKEELERSVQVERKPLLLPKNEVRLRLTDLPIWTGTTSLQTFDRSVHTLTPTSLTQFVTLQRNCWRTAFTLPIDEGEWELKIRASENTFFMLGFLQHPLPENATEQSCGFNRNGIGGHFTLWNGKMWRDGEMWSSRTNAKCSRIGQTAAIRVNMKTREARLVLDDEEQPGIFTDIPSPLCLGITTGFTVANLSLQVLWLKRL
ncbi:hypothetical protein BLNAU_12123 [Blattamonas nauphoetae]|uniref:Uncharacterized protein n=1 Tax=Blattamonas nauphoetae TaxID=2049346 RepID=A0ABQ9XQL6_9EUKA|nr:hypothetical protein BLNAU_12123 [Blattamonas nauphoetae]